MEYSNINTDTNKLWEEQRKKQDKAMAVKIEKRSRLAELSYMRDLFHEYLPVGEDLTQVDAYLDNIEQIIETNGTIHDEQFDDERDIIDPETGCRVTYRYHSSNLTFKRALANGDSNRLSIESDKDLLPHAQGLGDPSPSRRGDSLQDQCEISQYPSHVEECQGGSTCNDQRPSDDESDDYLYSGGKLECCRNS